MTNRLVLPLVVIVLIIGGVIFSNHHDTVSSQHRAKVAAAERAKLPACLTENPSVAPSAAEQNSLELVVLSHLDTIPAGTSVTIQFSNYSTQQAAGSVQYAGEYGDYNFQTIQTGHSQGLKASNGTTDGGWKLTSFSPCNKG